MPGVFSADAAGEIVLGPHLVAVLLLQNHWLSRGLPRRVAIQPDRSWLLVCPISEQLFERIELRGLLIDDH
jgi:hypothetical protein